MTEPIKVNALHAWIGITPEGHECILTYRSVPLVSDLVDDGEGYRWYAEQTLHQSKTTESPLARIELRTLRCTP